MNTPSIANQVREHRSLLASREKLALVWMAQRLPRWVGPDHLTALGLLSMLLAGVAYWAARYHAGALVLVVAGLALNWFGDSLDGTVARVRKLERPRYGFYVDHVVDSLSALFLFGGLALSGYMNPLVALGLLVAYLMVMAESFLATYVRGIFRLSSFGFGPTELRIILAIGTLYLLYRPLVRLGSYGPFLLFDIGGVVAIAGLMITLTVSAVRNARALYDEERLPS
jgi:archaetidylinositol phosphate synthase